ncbi:MAG: radical SAM family heme chaperone HemW [Faecalibacterium sp.]|nr:radical SAM family heme chaperone HemW [Faecalibacterium sp.]
MLPFGVYYHIPYCVSKCRYCDFYSRGACRTVPPEYTTALLREVSTFAGGGRLQADTVYFGGGTPSLLPPADAAKLIEAAGPVPGAEITLEANPDTVTEALLREYRAAGVNRISFGVQSARDSQLQTLGRAHTAQQARAAFAAARAAGFENITGDIMLALPHYSYEEFDETLALIAGGGATHISAYLLKIEPTSYFGKHPPEGLPDPDAAADFYLYAVQQLEQAGYKQYEISNFAQPGFEGKHNLIYWNCGDYLGIGPAAHSCVGGRRFYYPPDTAAFLAGQSAPIEDGGCGAEDFMMLQLRLTKGLSLAEYQQQWGRSFTPAQLAFIRNLAANGYARFDGQTLALTPQGLLVQNTILAELL